ncbi:MAG: Gfo/Idh/MocA family oxidoreductase [Planctomycetota bacterium]
MDKVRLGVVGLGGIFQVRHRPALSHIPEASIEMVADVDADLARRTGEELHCRHTARYREVMRDPKIDAVFVCVPPFLHEEIAVDAALSRKHVLCEKPLAPTTAACDAIVRAAEKNRVKLMVAENWLFDPLTLLLRECVADGRWGRLRRARFFQGWSGPDQPRFYKSPRPGRNGVFLEDGIHMIAMSRALLGPVRAVTATKRTLLPERSVRTGTVPSRVEDDATATLELEGGTAVCEVTWLIQGGGLHCEFHFERASIAVSNPGWDKVRVDAVVRDAAGKIADLELPPFGVRTPVSAQSYLNENEAFLRSVLDDTPSPYSGEEAREDVRIMELIYDSTDQRKTLRAS